MLVNASGRQTHQRCTPTVHEDVQNGVWNVCHDHVYLVYSDINPMCITVSLDKVCMTKEWYYLEMTYGWLDEQVCLPAPIHSIGVLPRPESVQSVGTCNSRGSLTCSHHSNCMLNAKKEMLWNASSRNDIFMLHDISSRFIRMQRCWESTHWVQLMCNLIRIIKHHQAQAQDSSESEGIWSDLKEPKNGTWMNLEWDPLWLTTQLHCYTEDPHWLQSHCPNEFSAFNALASLRSSSHSRHVQNVFGIHHFDQWD